MKFAFALLSIAAGAALQLVGAGPIVGEGLTKRAPVPVTKLVCDGNSYKCTAFLDYGDGRWVAQWSSDVFHEGHFRFLTESPMTSMAPVPVTKLTCDGNTYKCTGNLEWGDGKWVAQWDVNVFHKKSLFSQEDMTMAPVPLKHLNCDGNSYTCTANLDYGDGKWVAEWETAVFHSRI